MAVAVSIICSIFGSVNGFSVHSGRRVPKIQSNLKMNFLQDLLKGFSGEKSDTPMSSTAVPSSKASTRVDPEPGRYPPKIVIPPSPKRKMTLKDLKTSDLMGKRWVACIVIDLSCLSPDGPRSLLSLVQRNININTTINININKTECWSVVTSTCHWKRARSQMTLVSAAASPPLNTLSKTEQKSC